MMPFTKTLRWVFDDLIVPACVDIGAEAIRGDDFARNRNILHDVVDGLLTCDAIVADLTGGNPNVYYELGAAHALMRPVILLTQRLNRVPFDLRVHRVLEYSDQDEGRTNYRRMLADLLKETLRTPIELNTPIAEHMPVPVAAQIQRANRRLRPVGDIWLRRNGETGTLIVEGDLENGLIVDPSYPIATIHWGSLVAGWGWDGNDAYSTPIEPGQSRIEVHGLRPSSIGDLRGTPYIRTAHYELHYFDLYLWRVHPPAAFHKWEANNRYSGILEYHLSKLPE